MNLKLGVDLSRYQEDLTEALFKQLVDNGMSFVIFKVQGVKQGTSIIVEDPKAEIYKAWCLKYAVPYGVYIYTYPGINYDTQINFTRSMQVKYNPKITFIDAEEYKNYSTNLPYSPDYLNGFYKRYYTDIVGVKGVYTGDWFVKGYVPKMVDWLKDVEYLWWAWYYRYYLSWKLFMVSLGLEPISITKLPQVVSWLENKAPGTMGLRWDIWQFESYMKIKEMGAVNVNLYHFDWNVIPEGVYAMLFGEVPPVVDPMVLEKAYRIDELKHRRDEIYKLFNDRIDEFV